MWAGREFLMDIVWSKTGVKCRYSRSLMYQITLNYEKLNLLSIFV